MNIQGFVPAITAPVQGQSATAVRPASTGSSSTSSTGTSSSDLQTTFLNLLVTELQNQDPTSPVDPTQMVSQMVSLNQLDQLISINQTLSNLSSGVTSTASGSQQALQPKVMGNPSSGGGNTSFTSEAQTATPEAGLYQVPAYTGAGSTSGLMNLYGSYKNQVTNSNSTYMGGK
jgi:flagellar basal-body rod modification protein FlgD